MPAPWHFTTFLDFLDHWQSLIAGGLALVAAIIAVFVTIRIERWKANKDEREALVKEIHVTNAITMVTFGIANTVLSTKKQHIKSLKSQFDQDRERTQQAIIAQQRGRGGEIEFRADFRTLPPLTLPLSLLQTQIVEHITVDKRPIALMTTLAQASDALNVSVVKRNQLIELYKSGSVPPARLMALYFGFPYDHGQVNQEYADLMQAIYNQADDIIFFSSQLSKELSEHGDQLAALFKRRFRKNVPRITKPDFGKAIAADLMPDEKNYADWFNMFVKREEPPAGWLRRFRNRFGA